MASKNRVYAVSDILSGRTTVIGAKALQFTNHGSVTHTDPEIMELPFILLLKNRSLRLELPYLFLKLLPPKKTNQLGVKLTLAIHAKKCE